MVETIIMGILMTIGVLTKLISYITVKKLVKAASEIQKSNHKFMKLIKAKFEHACMVSDKVQNVNAFVQKYLYEYKVFGVRLDAWIELQKKIIWFVVVLGLFGTANVYRVQGFGEQAFRYGAVTVACGVFLFSIHILGNENAKKEAAKNYMVDYLENVCLNRYQKANQLAAEAREEVVEEAPASEQVEVEEAISQTELLKEAENTKEREEQQMRIRAILEEFLA